ncbi:MAG TPA: M3 family metallopeptidase [Bryobacteraceae bacterium]|nr:M3 family metallopeptidase [Bryobacteraceae bacterium]HPT25595.1 M3 family metallopeptidase [Bryobacteraceae bacterium]
MGLGGAGYPERVAPSNPLLSDLDSLPFDRVEAVHVRPALDVLLDDARRRIDSIAAPGAPKTFDRTMAALDTATENLDMAVAIVRHLEAVATTAELRDAWNEAQPAVIQFYSSIPLNGQLWRAIKDFASTGEADALTGVRRRFLDKTIEGFRRHGADLSSKDKQALESIDVELANVTTRFAQNVLDATTAWEYVVPDPARLAGLPESAVAAARDSAASKGIEGWRFTLQQPSYVAVMTYLDDAATREVFYRVYNARAAEVNAALIPQILDLRRRKARLLGYADFSDFATADRMAASGEAAACFVDELRCRTEAAFQCENEALIEFRRSREPDATIEPWDVAYWAEKMRTALYEFDEEDLRPYFSLDNVVAGLFDLCSRIFGIRVTPAPGAAVWDEAVRHYQIHDASGALLAHFYADWFPRETKRGGAWMDSFVTGGPAADGFRPHAGFVCGNLTPPLPDRPSLLTHSEVETIFHEFGHLLHHCLSQVEIRSFAGTNVAWDFVELPSQIMENWCWERISLDLFARHYQTGQLIPDELFHKMIRARTFRAANAQMRQLGFATLDLALHRDSAGECSIIEAANRILAPFCPVPLPEGYAMVCAFTHLFADPVGYGAGYYSYKWAEVLDADAFTRFLNEGVFNSGTGMAFRNAILEKGNSQEPADLFRLFMGRDPNPSALLARLGLN